MQDFAHQHLSWHFWLFWPQSIHFVENFSRIMSNTRTYSWPNSKHSASKIEDDDEHDDDDESDEELHNESCADLRGGLQKNYKWNYRGWSCTLGETRNHRGATCSRISRSNSPHTFWQSAMDSISGTSSIFATRTWCSWPTISWSRQVYLIFDVLFKIVIFTL